MCTCGACSVKMNGPLIITVIHLIKALRCAEEETIKANETKLETKQEVIKILNATEEDTRTYSQEVARIIDSLQQKCTCPCNDVPQLAVCGKTTSGHLKTFDSQCHLICHNQCDSVERYAIVLYQECPTLQIVNRKNVFSTVDENRRNDYATGGAYTSIITPLQWECDCTYCPQTRWIRFDYYPICAERGGQRITFESWCHFDCENRCVRHTGYVFLYLYKGACEGSMQEEYTEDLVIPRDFSVSSIRRTCDLCSTQCKTFFEPVCAKNPKNEYLSFKSRCHLRCHNQCYQDTKQNYVEVYDGQCPWL